jgi:hypothetical protein
MSFIEKSVTSEDAYVHGMVGKANFNEAAVEAARVSRRYLEDNGCPPDIAELYEKMWLPFTLTVGSRGYSRSMGAKEQAYCLQIFANMFMQIAANDETIKARLEDKAVFFLNRLANYVMEHIKAKSKQDAAEAAATRQ